MNIRPGIKIIKEIEGHGPEISKGDRFEAVYKFYYNKGDPILFETRLHKPIPEVKSIDGKDVIAWDIGEPIKSHVIYQYNGWLVRQSDMLVGIYYSVLGMKTMGYRFVKIAPHFMSDSIYNNTNIKKGSIIKMEIFLISFTSAAKKSSGD